MRESLILRYNVCFRLVDALTRAVTDERWVHNLALTVGKREALSTSSGKALKDFVVILVGTGSAAPDVSDTGLLTPVVSGSGSQTNPTPDILQTQVTFNAGAATGAIREGGLSLAAGASDASGSVSARSSDADFTVGGNGHASGFYDGGTVEFTSGANVGLSGSITTHTLVSGNARVILAAPMGHAVAVSDGVILRPNASAPAMLCRVVLGSPVAWDASHDLVVTWQLTLS